VACGSFFVEKKSKKEKEKFGGKEKMSTFAIPNEKRVTQTLVVWQEKFIEKTDYCTRSKYRENTIYREALILLKNYKCQRQAKNYIEIIQ
jgi:hypothetical protein